MIAAILTDLTRCVGCGACAAACREINALPGTGHPRRLSSDVWTFVDRRCGVNIRRQCMHCLDPTCVSVCPVTALEKKPEGAVVYHEDRCIGCRYCIMACPFEIPKYEWDNVIPRVRKCLLCYDLRLSRGEQPACTSVCPSGATVFGDRDRMIEEARRRIADHPGRYQNRLYGLEEAEGTSVLYLSDLPFEQLGFPKTQIGVAYPHLTWNVLSKIPNVAAIGGVLMLGIWWITRRRDEVGEAQDGEKRLTPDAGNPPE